MAYGDGHENARLVLRAVRGSFDFSGRSRRTELVFYAIATALAGVIIGFPLSAVLPFGWSIFVGQGLSVIFAIPFLALFVRRLHDQDRSGWWALLLVAGWLIQVWNWIQLDRFWVSPPRGGVPDQAPWWISLPLIVALWAFTLWSGTAGPNRYGEDPRLAE